MEDGPVAGGSFMDGVLQDRISGEVGWQQKSYPLSGDGTHALVWVYSKDSSGESGSDRGWVDYLQWTPSGGGGGSSTTDWEQITYTYDPSGRRIAWDDGGVAEGCKFALLTGAAWDDGAVAGGANRRLHGVSGSHLQDESFLHF